MTPYVTTLAPDPHDTDANPRDERGRFLVTIVERTCECCGAPMNVKPSVLKRGYGRYCSLLCANRTKRRPKLKPRPLLDHPTDPALLLVQLRREGSQVAIIDRQDAEIIAGRHWTANYCRKARVWYAVSKNAGPGKAFVRMHRLILDAPEGPDVDHKNGNGLDNRRANLRIATRSQNNVNGGPPRNNTSGFRGVSWNKSVRRWDAYITKDRKRIRIGYFDSAEAAAVARDAKARELFGDFARLNLPEFAQ